jgi:hypothetical protein
MKDMRFVFPCIFPCSDISILIIVSESLPIRSLILFPEMCAARFVPVKGISYKKFAKFKIISNPTGFFKFLVKFSKFPGNIKVSPKLIP